MEIARDHFEEAYRLDPTRPEAATEMIEIAMAGHARSGEDERFWFKRAVTAQIDWPVAYGTMRWALRPRWGGSYDAMYRFGLECMQSGRYDTDVPFQLIRALLDIAEDNEGSLDFWVTRDVQPVVNEVLTKLADRPEHTHRIVYYRTHAAGFAWATQRYEEASERIKAIAGSLDEDALAEMRLTGRRILDDVAIFTSPVAERVAEADEAFEWGRPALAIEGYAAALAETAAPDVVGPLRDRLVTATILRDFMSGEWVPLQFERGLPGWRVRGGIWHASVPEAINGGPNSTGLRLICQAPVGARFELRGRINMKNLHYLKSTNAAIYFRYRENRDRSDWQAFQIYNVEKRGWIGYRFWKVKGEYMPIEEVRNRLYEFHLKLWDTHATLRINGKPVFAGRVGKGDSWTPGSLFGLGGSYNGTRGYAVFDNLELRRLLEPPQALAELLQREQEWP